jgi:hypothetical protein
MIQPVLPEIFRIHEQYLRRKEGLSKLLWIHQSRRLAGCGPGRPTYSYVKGSLSRDFLGPFWHVWIDLDLYKCFAHWGKGWDAS